MRTCNLHVCIYMYAYTRMCIYVHVYMQYKRIYVYIVMFI